MKLLIFGGQYGSEGKGSVGEYFAGKASGPLIVAGENSPNSGHTCSLGKTRNIPASSFFASVVILGPDSVIDPQALHADLVALDHHGRRPEIIIHENAAITYPDDSAMEQSEGLVKRVASTASGSGLARWEKYYSRVADRTIGRSREVLMPLQRDFPRVAFRIVNRAQYQATVRSLSRHDWIFECSQGLLLDPNWGIFPYCTSRTTLPGSAVDRNGLGHLGWVRVGVYRTYPIRTGGNSGPTPGDEIQWADLGVEEEIATVTKRVRRVFEFSDEDFFLSTTLGQPDVICFTHLDYLPVSPVNISEFKRWLESTGVDLSGEEYEHCKHSAFYLSCETGQFTRAVGL